MSEDELHDSDDSGGSDLSVEFNLPGDFQDHGATSNRKKVFRDENGFPIGFIFHKSVGNARRKQLTRQIKAHGGIVLDGPMGADTLLVDNSVNEDLEQFACTSSTDKARARLRVERVSFVQRCIDRKVFRHASMKISPMTGIPENTGRTPFTSEDFEHLAWFLSRMVPDSGAGGRQSLRLYAMLVNLGDTDPEYKWVKRHTAESWKEHNKKNKAKYHTRIAQLVKAEPPDPSKVWPYDRRATKAASKGLQNDEEPQKSSEEDDSDAQFEPVSRKRRISGDTSRTMHSPAKRPRTSYGNSTSKGKARAVEAFEESEEEVGPRVSDKDSLFDADPQFDDEPGPSTGARSPERTLDVSATANPSTRNFPTQETLVGTARHSPPTQPFAARKAATLPARKTANSGDRTVPISLPATSGPPPPTSSSPVRVTPRSSQLMPPPPEQAVPQPYRPPVKAAHRKGVLPGTPEESSAPFRNLRRNSRRDVEPQQAVARAKTKPINKTRRIDGTAEVGAEVSTKGKALPPRVVRASSRLRSVEPEILPLPGRRTAQKKRAEPIVEDEDEHENPVGETLAEEQDVANLLAADSAEVSARQSRDGERGVSMDTDDVHIARGLYTESSSTPRKFDFLTRNPTDVLKRAQTASRRHSMHPGASGSALAGTQTPIQHPTQYKQRQSVPTGSRVNMPRPSQLVTPRTPFAHEQRGSSAESFPLPGTRARTVLEEVQRYEGSTPYKPPPGTRAAAAITEQGF